MAYGSNLTNISHLQKDHFMSPETFGQLGQETRRQEYYSKTAEAFRDVPNVDILSLDDTQLESLIQELESSLQEVQAAPVVPEEQSLFGQGVDALKTGAQYAAMGVAAPFYGAYKGAQYLKDRIDGTALRNELSQNESEAMTGYAPSSSYPYASATNAMSGYAPAPSGVGSARDSYADYKIQNATEQPLFNVMRGYAPTSSANTRAQEEAERRRMQALYNQKVTSQEMIPLFGAPRGYTGSR